MSEKVLMYARVGNIGQMAEARLDLQLQAVEEFCRQKGYEIVGTKTCVGGGEKAISFLPPLAEEAKQREATMIVTCSMDRFTRDYDSLIKFEDDLRKENIKVLSAEETTEPSEMDKVLQAIFEKFKEYEK